MHSLSPTRLYASSIAIVSGLYAIVSPLTAGMRTPMMMEGSPLGLGGLIMLTVGFVVLVHGTVLLTPVAARIGQASGPLMVVWAAIMLINQLLLGIVPGFGMAGMAWDGGMVAIAILMLVSGLIMTTRQSGSRM